MNTTICSHTRNIEAHGEENEDVRYIPYSCKNREASPGCVPKPALISWNVTFRCPLRCPHCYIDASKEDNRAELDTRDALKVIDQIAGLGTRVLILSGGEPLLRADIFELAAHAKESGLHVSMGTSGIMIDDEVAIRMKDAGIRKAAISLDSADSLMHDRFRGLPGAWSRTVNGIQACLRHGIGVLVNITILRENYRQVPEIISFCENLGVTEFQLFFLVPTGRGTGVDDITPEMYETIIHSVMDKTASGTVTIRPTCAPQYTRIRAQLGMEQPAFPGCLAGKQYCRIYPDGDVTPCPYLPLRIGNVTTTPLAEIWQGSAILNNLRNPDLLEGKCGACEFRRVCGGCRARAYGLHRSAGNACGKLDDPKDSTGNYLAEEPWCLYVPEAAGGIP
jgi:radical SAM protein with 4Fe4S-binding SPASM domain